MNDDRLASLLRQHDPAAGKTLTDFDRTRILHRALEPRGRRRGVIAPFVFAALTLFVVALVTLRREPAAAPQKQVRQVQYATPGGTRIVWTLDPNFHM